MYMFWLTQDFENFSIICLYLKIFHLKKKDPDSGFSQTLENLMTKTLPGLGTIY